MWLGTMAGSESCSKEQIRAIEGSDLLTTTWVFDVDACLFDSLTGTSLRPGAREILTGLVERSCRVMLWSAGGAAYAHRRAETHEVSQLFEGFYDKKARDGDGRYSCEAVREDLNRFVFVDDRPEDVPFRGECIAVSPYVAPSVHDRGLAPVARRAGLPMEVS